MLTLHPKIQAAALMAVLVAVVTVGNAVLDVYATTSWAPILGVVLTVLAGYLKSSGPKA